jgi:hypothetical protein
MHQSQFIRDKRNRYFFQLARLHQLADATGIEPASLVAYLDHLRKISDYKEAAQALNCHPINDTNTGVHTP